MHTGTMEWRKISNSFPCMGTLVRISLYTRDEARANRAIAAAKARFELLNAILSDYLPTSELNRLCRAPHLKTTKVSADLFAVLSFSQRLALLSHGAFDVTIGARTRGRKGIVGYRHMALGNHTVTLLKADMQLDLGGVAKGYATDQASRVLREHGQDRHLVAASGDIRVWDAPPGVTGWSIGLGGDNNTEVLARCAVSTSGNTYQPGHIFDPRTLAPIATRDTMTIVAPDGMTADGLATACMVLPAEERAELLTHFPRARLIVLAG